MPLLVLLGSGIALNNSMAVVQAFSGRGSPFRRTPKFRLEGRNGRWKHRRYALRPGWMILGELLLTLYAAVTIVVAWSKGHVWAIPSLSLYLLGFGMVATVGLWQWKESTLAARRAARAYAPVRQAASSKLTVSPSSAVHGSRR
jgi:hypothetical protein